MNKIKDFLGGALAVLFYVLIIYGEIFGIYHSAKKHTASDVVVSIAIPPWAWWRSIEAWWHDDYAKVDWDKRLANDMQTSIYFINQGTNSEGNKYELNEDIEKFSDKIKKYPKDKLVFLTSGTRYFIEYSNSTSNDFMNSFKKYSETGEFSWMQSDKTQQLEKKLADYNLNEDIQFAKKALEETSKQLKDNLPDNTSLVDLNKIESMKTTMILTMESQQKEYRRIFKSLFNEEL